MLRLSSSLAPLRGLSTAAAAHSSPHSGRPRKRRRPPPARLTWARESAPCHTGEELLDRLMDGLLYHDPENDKYGLVAVNKPNGLPVRHSDDSEFSLVSALPTLADALEVEKLHYISAPERFSSGVTLLSSTEEGVERVKKCFRRARTQLTLTERYLAVTNAFPRVPAEAETVDVVSKRVDVAEPVFGDHHVEPVILRSLVSRKALKEQREDAKRYHVNMQTLARSGKGPAALVSLEPSSTRHNFMAVYLAEMLSPMLGDKFYSYRAKMLMGHMTKVGYKMSPHTHHQILPEWMLKALGIHESQTHLLPKHLHLMRKHLPGYLPNGRNLTLFAKPPEYFDRTAEALDIKYDIHEIMTSDVVMTWRETRKKAIKAKEEEDSKVKITHNPGARRKVEILESG